MGTCCCKAESPCGSVEERSGLLKDDLKASCTGEKVVGSCGPEGEDNMSATDEGVKTVQHFQNKEMEANNTQENGHLQKEKLEVVKAPPNKESSSLETSEEKESTSTEVCTLNMPERDPSSADEEEAAASKAEPDEGKHPKKRENAPETSTKTDEAFSDDVIAEVKPSDEAPSDKEVFSVPDARPAAAGQTAATSDTDSSVVAEASDNSRDVGSHNEKSHVLSQPTSGPNSAEPDRSETHPDSSGPAELEPTASSEAGESSKSGQEEKSDQESLIDSGLDAENDAVDEKRAKTPEINEAELKENEEISEGIQSEEKEVKSLQTEAPQKQTEILEEAGNDEKEESRVKDLAEEMKQAAEEQDSFTGDDEKENVGTEKYTTVTGNEEVSGKGETGHQMTVSSGANDSAAGDDGGISSDEDLYRGAEEHCESDGDELRKPSDLEYSKVEDRFSLAPAVDILSYSEREWKGNTAKSALIRKGYKEMSQKFSGLRRVRGDNYCALRATMFQVLSQSCQLPDWLQDDDIMMLPTQLEAQEGLMSLWRFPGGGGASGDSAQQLKGYMELLRDTWRAAAGCPSAPERLQLCERLFQGGEEELGLLEAVKLLMLGRAAELHGRMQGGGDVPLFCWLLFARDSSDSPRSFLSNHLRHVGLSAGLEQVEMFLLGYALQHTIQVYRLYKADTEEFVTFYPDDHKDDWPSVCLVTEDDRHYNVPVCS